MNPLLLVWPSITRFFARLALPRIEPSMWGERQETCHRGVGCPCYQRGYEAGQAEASALLR